MFAVACRVRSWFAAAVVVVAAACADDPTPGGASDAADASAGKDGGADSSGDPGKDSAARGDSGSDATGETGGGASPFQARGSVGQVYVTHAAPGQALELRDATGAVKGAAKADKLGSLVFRKVPPAKGYKVFAKGPAPEAWAGPVDVVTAAESQPPQSFYSGQKIAAGTGYLTTRDGTTLSYFATLPGPAAQGPYPTIVNYSGYSPSRPGKEMVSGDQKGLCDAMPVLCNAPDDPTAMIAAVAGYATVSVNIRGTGCSGGAYDYFEELQLLDGYDVIEIVAAQPWVAHHKVGMTGLSYPGITQLFVAKMKPPGLAAITPLSVIGNTATTLVPGGILNNGFALSWINHVLNKAAPYGQGWEKAKVDGGDTICKENQLLHDQRVNNVDQAKDPAYYTDDVITPLNPSAWADQIAVPVFMACAWQDEQTGPYFTTLLHRFTSAPNRRFMVYNGVHSDGFAPQILVEWKAFLDLHVARTVPSMPTFFGLLIPEFTKSVYGVGLNAPADRWLGVKDHAAALAKWQAEPEVQVLIENGATDPAGAPQGHFPLTFDSWPPKATQASRWYFAAGGALLPQAPTATAAASSFQFDPKAGDRGIDVDKLWAAGAKYKWNKPAPGFEVSFVSAPLDQDLVMVGTGSVDLWLRSAKAGVTDADVEVNLSEIRPDGQERYVQSGWLRASFRALSPAATELWPEPNMIYKASTPLVVGEWTKVRVAIAGFAHPFRKGSRIRVAVDTPGDSRVDWRFANTAWPVGTSYDIGHDAARPSSVALPVIAGAAIPAGKGLPACNALRGQPCRAHTDVPNVAVAP